MIMNIGLHILVDINLNKLSKNPAHLNGAIPTKIQLNNQNTHKITPLNDTAFMHINTKKNIASINKATKSIILNTPITVTILLKIFLIRKKRILYIQIIQKEYYLRNKLFIIYII